MRFSLASIVVAASVCGCARDNPLFGADAHASGAGTSTTTAATRGTTSVSLTGQSAEATGDVEDPPPTEGESGGGDGGGSELADDASDTSGNGSTSVDGDPATETGDTPSGRAPCGGGVLDHEALVGCWDFESLVGTVAPNLAGGADLDFGANTPAVLVPGFWGMALATEPDVLRGTAPGLVRSSAFTIEVWFRADAWPESTPSQLLVELVTEAARSVVALGPIPGDVAADYVRGRLGGLDNGQSDELLVARGANLPLCASITYDTRAGGALHLHPADPSSVELDGSFRGATGLGVALAPNFDGNIEGLRIWNAAIDRPCDPPPPAPR